jgi:hypothetical protein
MCVCVYDVNSELEINTSLFSYITQYYIQSEDYIKPHQQMTQETNSFPGYKSSIKLCYEISVIVNKKDRNWIVQPCFL